MQIALSRIAILTVTTLSTISTSACDPPPCESSQECREVDGVTECLLAGVAPPTCASIDADRVIKACTTLEDCAGFPIEAACDEDVCKCPDITCDGAYFPATCLCYASDGDVGATCFDVDDCNTGFSCVDLACTDEPQIGGPCTENGECAGGPELLTCINRTCRRLPDDNGVCDDNPDCRIRPTDRCVNGQCHTNAGQPGERCFGDSDCFTQVCVEQADGSRFCG